MLLSLTLLAVVAASVVAVAAPATVAAATAPPFTDAYLIGCAHGSVECSQTMANQPPPVFDVRYTVSSGGSFTIHVVTALAPPMATRFYILSMLGYSVGGPFYRVLNIDANNKFVAQMGYRGSPAVDIPWVALQLSNATAGVVQPNVRGTVVFGTNEVVNKHTNPNCTALLCSMGFSVELFINLVDNPALDASDFSPFGTIDAAGMEVVDALYAGYGECADECDAAGDGDPFCVPNGSGGWRGVNLTRMLEAGDGGHPYLKAGFPLLDYVTGVEVL